MRFARLIGGVGAMLATAAAAAQGDALLVTGNNVNVRAGPSTDAGILARVNVDEPATEMRREGAWVEVELPGRDVLGWIHGSLLTSAPEPAGLAAAQEAPATDPVPRAAPAAASPPVVTAATTPRVEAVRSADGAADALELFRSDVEHFNNRAIAAAGVELFTGVQPLGAKGVQVVTTDAWAIMSTPGQQSYLNALYGRWQAAKGGGDDLHLQIVDSSGVLMAERTGP